MVGGGNDHTTTALRSTRLPDDDDSGMVLWHTWGVSEETYKRYELKLILEQVGQGLTKTIQGRLMARYNTRAGL